MRRERKEENVVEVIMAESFPKLTEAKPQIKESQRIPTMINTQISTPCFIIFKFKKKSNTKRKSKEAGG